jgi:nitronate monooxygenase
MLAAEAGTSAPHRAALARSGETRLTRAFSGRRARGIVNRFMREHGAVAPSAYPEIHHLTAPIRAAARQAGDEEALNLWAGQAHALARQAPAAEIVRSLGAEAREVASVVARRLQRP